MAYKMNGFSGFGNSPLKKNRHTDPLSTKGEILPGSRKYRKAIKNKPEVDPTTQTMFDVIGKKATESFKEGKKQWEEGKKEGSSLGPGWAPLMPTPLKQEDLHPELYTRQDDALEFGREYKAKQSKAGSNVKTNVKTNVKVHTGFGPDADRRMSNLVNKRVISSNVKTTTGVVGKKVAKKAAGVIGSRLIPGAGWALAAHDVYKIGKKIKGGHSFGEALKSHYLGIDPVTTKLKKIKKATKVYKANKNK